MVVRNKSTLQTKFALGVVPVLEAIGFKLLLLATRLLLAITSRERLINTSGSLPTTFGIAAIALPLA
jgi:hypothetical protein